MPVETQNDWRRRFVSHPPALSGGASLAIDETDTGLWLRFEHHGVRAELRAAFLTVPYPSGLKRLLASDPDLDAVIVERIPSGLDATAEELGVSYLDPRGNGCVVAPGFIYVVPPRVASGLGRTLGGDLPEARPGEPRQSVRRVSPFAPKSSRLVRALLAAPERRWRLSKLAHEVEVDPGNAHRVLASLQEMGLVERDEDEYVVPDPSSLLEAWAEAAHPPRERISLTPQGDLRKWLRSLVEARPAGFAVSGEIAAELLVPYLEARQVLIHCLDDDALEAVRVLREEDRGELIRFPFRAVAVAADARVGDYGDAVDGIPLVSPAQLYVDLYRQRGRGREAAEQVRRGALGY